LNDFENEGREFRLKKTSHNNNGVPVIESIYYKAGSEPKHKEE